MGLARFQPGAVGRAAVDPERRTGGSNARRGALPDRRGRARQATGNGTCDPGRSDDRAEACRVGSGGAGKSTFAVALGEATGLPVVHLDRHFWHPGWAETPREEWSERQRELCAGERWIANGNDGGTFDERFARADTVIIVARNRLACLTSALWRTTKNQGKAVQADGCPERFRLAFYRWIWNYRRDARARLDASLARHPHLEIVELTNRRSLRQFLARLDAR